MRKGGGGGIRRWMGRDTREDSKSFGKGERRMIAPVDYRSRVAPLARAERRERELRQKGHLSAISTLFTRILSPENIWSENTLQPVGDSGLPSHTSHAYVLRHMCVCGSVKILTDARVRAELGACVRSGVRTEARIECPCGRRAHTHVL